MSFIGSGGDLLERYARTDATKRLKIMKMSAGGSQTPSTIMQNEILGGSGDLLETSCFKTAKSSFLDQMLFMFWRHVVDCWCHVGTRWILKGPKVSPF